MSDFEDMWLQEDKQSYFSKVAQVEAHVFMVLTVVLTLMVWVKLDF